jgi:hypothetical protein
MDGKANQESAADCRLNKDGRVRVLRHHPPDAFRGNLPDRIKPRFPIWSAFRLGDGVHRAALPVGQLVYTSQHLNGSHAGEPWGLYDSVRSSLIAVTHIQQKRPPRRRSLPLIPVCRVTIVRVYVRFVYEKPTSCDEDAE